MPIHPLAVVDPKADIHPDAIIGPFCCIRGQARIAAGAELRNHVTVYGRASIGKGTVLYPSCVVGSDPQDLKFRGEDSEVVIGDNCRVHEFVTISKGTAGGGMKTTIGNECLVMAYAHIAHDCQLADHVVIGNNSQLAGHVKVGRKAIINGMCGIHHFVTIGDLAYIGAMSGVRCDVPPYIIADGHPAEPRKVNLVGLRRDGAGDDDIRALKDAFRVLFHDRDRSAEPLSETVVRLRREVGGSSELVDCICAWVVEHLHDSVKGRAQEAQRGHATLGHNNGHNGHPVADAVKQAPARV